jgi:hypothetical protein
MALVPVCAYREFVGFGKTTVGEIGLKRNKGMIGAMARQCPDDEEVWFVQAWTRFEDGHEEPGQIHLLLFGATEKHAREDAERMVSFLDKSKEDLEALSRCFKAKEEDLAYIEERFPNFQGPVTGPGGIEANDLYQARLKVLAGLQPKTASLIQKADDEKDPERRRALERETVNAYFAELANSWTEEEVLAWQRNNPVGTEWMRELARLYQEPERRIDDINYELAFNWLRRKYNLLSAEELSDMILVATGQRLMPGTLKKRRERLGLTTKYPVGRSPKTKD